MMLRHTALTLVVLLIGAVAVAQEHPIVDPDDSVDPRSHDGALFISRVVLGGAIGPIDDYRPLHQNTGFVSLANSLYWRHIQLDYKISDMSGSSNPVSVCGCAGNPIYFPTPPSRDSIPAPPSPGPKETAQFA